MRSRLLVVLISVPFVVLLNGAVATAHTQTARLKCGFKRAATEQATSSVRVVSRPDRDGEWDDWYACIRVEHPRTGAHLHGYSKRRFLGRAFCDEDSCGGGPAAVFAGGYGERFVHRVAFAYTRCGRGVSYCTTKVSVVDLDSGRRATTVFETWSGSPAYFEVAPSGTAVWLEDARGDVDKIRGLTLAGETPVFDEGVALTELALTYSTLYWKRAGEIQTAEVP